MVTNPCVLLLSLQAFDAAFQALNTNATALLANKALLTRILSYHVVPDVAAKAADLKVLTTACTLPLACMSPVRHAWAACIER